MSSSDGLIIKIKTLKTKSEWIGLIIKIKTLKIFQKFTI